MKWWIIWYCVGEVEWSSVLSCRVMTYVWRVVQVIKGIIAVGELILGVNKWVTEWNELLICFFYNSGVLSINQDQRSLSKCLFNIENSAYVFPRISPMPLSKQTEIPNNIKLTGNANKVSGPLHWTLTDILLLYLRWHERERDWSLLWTVIYSLIICWDNWTDWEGHLMRIRQIIIQYMRPHPVFTF